MNDHRRGALIGLAVDDALGATVEFKSPGSFKPVTGYRTNGPHGLADEGRIRDRGGGKMSEQEHVDLNQLRPRSSRNESLPPELLIQIEAIFDVKAVACYAGPKRHLQFPLDEARKSK